MFASYNYKWTQECRLFVVNFSFNLGTKMANFESCSSLKKHVYLVYFSPAECATFLST